MTISCIVPVYNSGKYLKKCIDSLLSQTRALDELILVDDGSTDESPRVCDHYSSQNPNISVIHKGNGGLISAWKAGVTASEGELLTFVDADDYVDRDFIEKLEKGVSPGDVRQISVCGGITEEEDTGRKTGDLVNSLPPGVYQGEELKRLHHRLLGNEVRTVSLSRCMKLISRELILDNMHFSDSSLTMGEDVSIMLPSLLDADRLSVTDASGYHYVKRAGSMVQGRDDGMYDQIRLLDSVISRIADEKKMPDGKFQREKEYVWLLTVALRNAFRGPDGAKEARDICIAEDTPELLRRTGIKADSLKNRLLLSVMKKPTKFRSSLVAAFFSRAS